MAPAEVNGVFFGAMKQVVARSLKKWILLVLLALLAYGAGWVFGTRQRNLQTLRNSETIEAGENAGAGIGFGA